MVRSVARRGDPLPVRAVDGGEDLAGMAVVRRLDLLARPGVPLPHRPVRRSRHQARAVRAERGATDLARVPPAGGQQRAGGRVPQARRPILAARGEPRAVRAEGARPDAVVVAVANGRLLPGGRVKHRDPPAACRPVRHASRVPSGLTTTVDGLCPFSGMATRQRTCPASSSKSKAVSSTHAATRRPRRVWATLTRAPAFGAERHVSCARRPPGP